MSKSRRPNFSSEELQLLANEIANHKNIIYGAFSDVQSNELKKKTWQRIAVACNAVSQVSRSRHLQIALVSPMAMPMESAHRSRSMDLIGLLLQWGIFTPSSLLVHECKEYRNINLKVW